MTGFARIGVVGCGLMGSGIAEVCARAGADVTVTESDAAAADLGRRRVEQSLDRAVSAGKLAQAAIIEAKGHMSFTTDMGELATCQLVIEAVSEQEDLKARVFSALDDLVEDKEAVLATNTSSIPIARLAAATSRPGYVIGLHFFNPVPVMGLVELTPSLQTRADVIERTETFARSVLGKDVVRAKDRAGFIVNALLVPYLLAAVRMVEDGGATSTDIDIAMHVGCAHPMGPLALADFIGLDTLKSIADVLYQEHKDISFAAPPLLSRMVEVGWLGKKSGRGFFNYP